MCGGAHAVNNSDVDVKEYRVWIHTLPVGQSAYAHVRIFSRSNTAGFKRLQRVLWWRQSCRASTLTLTFSKRHSLCPVGRPSDVQFQSTSLRVFTLPSSLKRCCPHWRGHRGTPPFQLAQREGKARMDLSCNRQSFLTTSSALLHCATPVQPTNYERVDGDDMFPIRGVSPTSGAWWNSAPFDVSFAQ